MNKYLLILVFPFVSCSMIFYRPAIMPREATIPLTSDEKAWELELRYEERDSFFPLSGTTIKKNFSTTIYPSSGEPFSFGKWIHPWKATNSKDQLIGLLGLEDEFGTMNRVLAILEKNKSPKIISSKGKIVPEFAISNNGTQFAWVEGDPTGPEGWENLELILSDSQGQIQFRTPVSQWMEGPDFGLVYNPSKSTFTYRMDGVSLKSSSKGWIPSSP
jgi:hypothetical protein